MTVFLICICLLILEHAQVHYNRRLASKSIRFWKVKSLQSLMEFNQLELAEWIYKKSCMKFYIQQWQKQAQVSLEYQVLIENARLLRMKNIKVRFKVIDLFIYI